MAAKDAVLSIRIPAELDARISNAAERLDLSKNDIARHALRAAIEAIESNDFHILLPLQMAVAGQPVKSRTRAPTKEKHPLADIAAAAVHSQIAATAPQHAIFTNEPADNPSHPASDAAGQRTTRTRRALKGMMKKEKDSKK